MCYSFSKYSLTQNPLQHFTAYAASCKFRWVDLYILWRVATPEILPHYAEVTYPSWLFWQKLKTTPDGSPTFRNQGLPENLCLYVMHALDAYLNLPFIKEQTVWRHELYIFKLIAIKAEVTRLQQYLFLVTHLAFSRVFAHRVDTAPPTVLKSI